MKHVDEIQGNAAGDEITADLRDLARSLQRPRAAQPGDTIERVGDMVIVRNRHGAAVITLSAAAYELLMREVETR